MNLVSCTVARAQPNSAELCSNCRMMTCQTPHGTAVLEKPLENPIEFLVETSAIFHYPLSHALDIVISSRF